MVASSCTQAESIAKAIEAHSTTLANNAETLWPALASAESTALKLANDVRGSLDHKAEYAANLNAASLEAARAVRRCAAEGADSVRRALGSTHAAIDAQRQATADALSSEEARWLELEKAHGATLRGLETSTNQALSAVEVATKDGQTRALNEKALADVAHKRSQAAMDELVQGCSQALVKQLSFWREGVSAPPLAAFTDDPEDAKADRIFDGAAFAELPAPAAAALRCGLPARPTEVALVTEFRREVAAGGA
jgi:hypothetical protein